MRLIVEEFKKILNLKYLKLLIITFLLTGLAFTSIQTYNLHSIEKYQVSKYDYFKGLITREKYQDITQIIQGLSDKYPMGMQNDEVILDTSDNTMSGSDFLDQFVYTWVIDEYDCLLNFKNQNNLALEKQKEKIEYLSALNLTKETQTLSKSTNRYNGRELTEYEYVDGVERFIHSDISIFFSLATIIFVGMRFTGIEKEQSMDSIIHATYIGRKYQTISKYIAIILFSLLVGLFFEVSTFFSFFLFDLIKGLHVPIYQLKTFAYSPFNLTVFNALILHYVIKATLLVFVGVGIVSVDRYSRNFVNTVILLFLISGILYLSSIIQVARGINKLNLLGFYILMLVTSSIIFIELLKIGIERVRIK